MKEMDIIFVWEMDATVEIGLFTKATLQQMTGFPVSNTIRYYAKLIKVLN